MVEPILGLLGLSAARSVASLTKDISTEIIGGVEDGFEAFMRGLMSDKGEDQPVSEEDLYGALLEERLSTQVSAEAATRYKELFSQELSARTRPDGYVFVEDAANAAMTRLTEEGVITADQKQDFSRQAFYAADLDGNTAQLFDGRGGEGDSSVAVASMEIALGLARATLEKGEIPDEELGTANESSEKMVPEGQSVDGAEGFVWKPESDHEKKLVVLLPAQITGDILEVVMKDKNGNEVERGRGSGVANGGREHFRFNRAGAEYPSDLTLEVLMKDGSRKEYQIPSPGLRYD
jgi:hypothetical protein